MHAARLMYSPRLLRVLAVLADGRPHSTREIVEEANVCAVNSCIAELRANGASVTCLQEVNAAGERRWYYTMTARPRDDA